MDIFSNQTAENIRSVCILAHVDHGKTTLADALLATNGFISAKSAGKLRFLDDRADEQERGITMKSSAIALTYRKVAAKCENGDEPPKSDDYVINLVDSPGHIDFSREVLTAARLCDGALVLVDVVEGVCAQTTAALRCVWDEQLSAILVLNKIDRLFTELRMNAAQAYSRLRLVLEQVNAVCADLFLRNSVFASDERQAQLHSDAPQTQSTRDTLDDTNCYFEAQRNVIFASAIDSWAFTPQVFSRLYAAKLGIDEPELLDRFWSDAFYSAAERRIVDGASERGRKPLFVQFALDNIASVYEAVAARDRPRVERIIASLNLSVKPQMLKCLSDAQSEQTRNGRNANETASRGDALNANARQLLRAIMGGWLPLAERTFDSIVDRLPPPSRLPSTRFTDWFSTELHADLESQRVSEALSLCDAQSTLQLAFVTKLICMPHLRFDIDAGAGADTDARNADLLAVARVYSGTLREGQSITVLDRKHSTGHPARQCTIERIYILRGRDLRPVTDARAGMIVGLAGLADCVTKYATVTNCVQLAPFEFSQSGGSTRGSERDTMIMRVAIEPERAADKRTLDAALERLARVDPEARVRVESNGETVLCAAGEVHLEKCLFDLRNAYCPTVAFNVSPIRVPFRETLVYAPDCTPHDTDASLDSLRDPKRLIDAVTAFGDCRIRVQACPLPPNVVDTLQRHVALVNVLQTAAKRPLSAQSLDSATRLRLATFRDALCAAFKDANWPTELAERLLAFGPREARSNLLLNATGSSHSVWQVAGLPQLHETASSGASAAEQLDSGSLIHGFQLACRCGPICGEPISNVCFLLFDCTKRAEKRTEECVDTDGDAAQREAARFGQLITTMKQACTRAFAARGGDVNRRLLLAMYSATVYTQFDQLGKVYTVLGRRFARFVSEDECSSSVLSIEALLPVVESVGFADELRRLTHGFASPTLRLTDWQVLEEDVDTLDESAAQNLDGDELYAASLTRARKYVNDVRRCKGLQIDEQIVVHAEKQSTLSKKK